MDIEQRVLKEIILHNETWYKDSMPLESTDQNTTPKLISVQSYWRWIFITVFILSKVFLIFAIYFYIKYKDAEFENRRIKYQIEAGNR